MESSDLSKDNKRLGPPPLKKPEDMQEVMNFVSMNYEEEPILYNLSEEEGLIKKIQILKLPDGEFKFRYSFINKKNYPNYNSQVTFCIQGSEIVSAVHSMGIDSEYTLTVSYQEGIYAEFKNDEEITVLSAKMLRARLVMDIDGIFSILKKKINT